MTGTPKGWLSYDAGIKALTDGTQDTATSYCIYSNQGGFEYYKSGAAGAITQDPTPGATPCA